MTAALIVLEVTVSRDRSGLVFRPQHNQPNGHVIYNYDCTVLSKSELSVNDVTVRRAEGVVGGILYNNVFFFGLSPTDC